jgi:hypothetical protein
VRTAMPPDAGDPHPSGPLPIRARRRLHPSWAARSAVQAAAAVLPVAQRERYTREFFAELHDVPRRRQLSHALGLLAHAGSLRAALHDTSPRPSGAFTMHTPLRCSLRLHHYVVRRNGEVQPPDRYEQCSRCGRVRNLPLFWPTAIGS